MTKRIKRRAAGLNLWAVWVEDTLPENNFWITTVRSNISDAASAAKKFFAATGVEGEIVKIQSEGAIDV